MEPELDRVFRLLEALGEPSRFAMVLALCARERHVSELAVEVGLSQSCTTRHLQALERAGVVHTRRAGKRVLAALALERAEMAQVAAWLREAGAPDAYAAAPAAAGGPGRDATSRPRRGTPDPASARPGRERARPPAFDRPRADGESSATPSAPPAPGAAPPASRAHDLDDFLL